jgi:hypothetical protein
LYLNITNIWLYYKISSNNRTIVQPLVQAKLHRSQS